MNRDSTRSLIDNLPEATWNIINQINLGNDEPEALWDKALQSHTAKIKEGSGSPGSTNLLSVGWANRLIVCPRGQLSTSMEWHPLRAYPTWLTDLHLLAYIVWGIVTRSDRA